MSPFLTTCQELYEELTTKLSKAGQFHPGETAEAELQKEICSEYLQKLKDHSNGFRFTNSAEEIYYYKVMKPFFVSEYLYYCKIYRLLSRWPVGSNYSQREHLLTLVKMIGRFYDEHHIFYEYYRTGQTDSDEMYFLRCNLKLRFMVSDPERATNFDNIVARLLAYNRLQEYLYAKLAALDKPLIATDGTKTTRRKLRWTASKSALTELIYGLKEKGVFENGLASVREIAEYLCPGADVDGVYNCYKELRLRKTDTTKFLTELRDALRRRMDGQDESLSK